MFKVNDLITNGQQAGVVIEIVAHDRRWKTSGARIMKIRTEPFGGNPGTCEFVPDYLSWKPAPLEWTHIPGGLQERWSWDNDHTMLQRHVRKAPTETT